MIVLIVQLLMTLLCTIVNVTAQRTDQCNSTPLKFLGTDNVHSQQFQTAKNALGLELNLLILQLPANNISAITEAIHAAEQQNLQLIIWPISFGHQWTPWVFNGSDWDITLGEPFLDYLISYIDTGGTAVYAYLMSHEPFWNHGEPFTSTQLGDLYTKLKAYAPQLRTFTYINNLVLNEYYYNNTVTIDDKCGDIVAVWWHGFGGQEGAPTIEQVVESVAADVALIAERGLTMELLFALQCFGWELYGYVMPTAAEIAELGGEILQIDGIQGVIWYSWGDYHAYTESLSKSQFDKNNIDRWETIRNISSQVCWQSSTTSTQASSSAGSALFHLSQTHIWPLVFFFVCFSGS